jgi:hypothetical protein
MKKMLLTIGAALAIATVPAAVVGAQGFGYQGGNAAGTQTQAQAQDQTGNNSQDQTRLHLHDGTGENHANCDGTSGDMHRYGARD